MRISDWSSDVCSSDLIPSGNALSQLLRRIRRTYPATPFSRRSAEARRPEPSGSAIPTESRREARETASSAKARDTSRRSKEHTSELQSLMRSSFAVFCLNKKKYDHHLT